MKPKGKAVAETKKKEMTLKETLNNAKKPLRKEPPRKDKKDLTVKASPAINVQTL